MDKRSLSETDIRTKFITQALVPGGKILFAGMARSYSPLFFFLQKQNLLSNSWDDDQQ